MGKSTAEVLDFVKRFAECFVFEASVVDKRDYTVINYTYELYPEDTPDFIKNYISNPESFRFKATVDDAGDQIDLRFDSETDCVHLLVFLDCVEDEEVANFLKSLID